MTWVEIAGLILGSSVISKLIDIIFSRKGRKATVEKTDASAASQLVSSAINITKAFESMNRENVRKIAELESRADSIEQRLELSLKAHAECERMLAEIRSKME